MSTAQAATFACEACGKNYKWKPQFAGKKLKCACGNVMQPIEPPATRAPAAAASSQDAGRDIQVPASAGCPECGTGVHAGAAICINCGTDLRTGMKVQTKVVAPAPKTTKKKKKAAPSRGPGMGKGEFTSFAQRRILADDPEEVAAKAKWNDVYWPTIALAVGLLLSIVDASWGEGSSDWKFSVTFVLVITIINVVFSFIGVLITSKLFSIGLGNLPTAILKVSAIALAPGAISSILSSKFSSGWVFGWIISVVLYYLMFFKFFDMDMMETMICSCIIWVMRTWVAYFLAMAIVAGIGLGSMGGKDKDDDFDFDTKPKVPKKFQKPTTKPQDAADDADDDEGCMVYPISAYARVVFV